MVVVAADAAVEGGTAAVRAVRRQGVWKGNGGGVKGEGREGGCGWWWVVRLGRSGGGGCGGRGGGQWWWREEEERRRRRKRGKGGGVAVGSGWSTGAAVVGGGGWKLVGALILDGPKQIRRERGRRRNKR
ncbi:glycine-rich protein DOT1-like [Arachis ipaensis]|uniref:glycine-rich protein DOT1-like n=1 Tax=Arachis ipaensis TaxID=130454 RepID=UPI0007AF7548|nr:glycine-rich protein DOT1-like [Arachis ipaensis]